MRRILIGVAIGLVAAILVVIALMSTGTSFVAVPLKYGPYEGNAIVSTPRFLIVYEGARSTGGGWTNVTIAGKYGTLRPFFGGYGTGWGGGRKGIDELHEYNADVGRATLIYFGHTIRVEGDGRLLRVQDGEFDLTRGKVVVRVDTSGSAHLVQGEQAREIEEALHPWFKSFEMSSYPVDLAITHASSPDDL